MAAAPTVVAKSDAIWGSSESVTRTCAWAAKPATASSMIERVGVRCTKGEEACAAAVTLGLARIGAGTAGAGVDSQRRAGFLARGSENRNDREDISARRGRNPHLRGLGEGRRLPGRPARARQGGTLLHCHPAAQRHWLAAYGPRAQQHAARHPLPLRAHARA